MSYRNRKSNVKQSKQLHSPKQARQSQSKKLNIPLHQLIGRMYRALLKHGFYDNIYLNECGSVRPDPSITIPESCQDRRSGLRLYKGIGRYLFYESPCRIGRGSTFCSQQILNPNTRKCRMIPGTISCPLCAATNESIVTPCVPLRSNIRYRIQGLPFIVIPNAYPYLDTQFLITTKTHLDQMQVMNNRMAVDDLYQLFKGLLQTDRDVIFFNGVCGNSLFHFHCQYTTSRFPLFILDKSFTGLYQDHGFLGYSIVSEQSQSLSDFFEKIVRTGLTYNFMLRKVNSKQLQTIVFVRDCSLPDGVNDLNYGATELAGIIVSNTKSTTTAKELTEYLNATHSIDLYDRVLSS